MSENCYILLHTDGTEAENGEGTPHFKTLAKAADSADTYWRQDLGVPVPRQRLEPCVTVECTDCGYVHDESGEGIVFHFDTEEEGLSNARGWEWQINGEHRRCPGCVEETVHV